MAVIVEEIKNITKNITKIDDNTIINTAWAVVNGWVENRIKKVLGIHTITASVFLDKKILYVSKRYTPLLEVKDEDNNKYKIISSDGVFEIPDKLINKEKQLTFKYGYQERLYDVETALARITAEIALQIAKDLVGIEVKTNNFDVSNLTEKYNWTDWSEIDILKKYFSEDKQELGCII